VAELYLVRPKRVRVAFAVIVAASLGACSAKAPPMKRIVRDTPADMRYLHDTFMPAYGGPSKASLAQSVDQLEKNLAEFEAFMRDVESGKIAVRQGLKGDWASFVEKRGSWIAAGYSDRLGPVIDFQKHQDKNPFPLVYAFTFTRDGYLTRADTLKDTFTFDSEGRVQEYHCPGEDL
jgi:hypothetical protein